MFYFCVIMAVQILQNKMHFHRDECVLHVYYFWDTRGTQFALRCKKKKKKNRTKKLKKERLSLIPLSPSPCLFSFIASVFLFPSMSFSLVTLCLSQSLSPPPPHFSPLIPCLPLSFPARKPTRLKPLS